MSTNQILFFIVIVSIVGFIFSIMFHKNKLTRLSKIKDEDNIHNANQKNFYLAIANIFIIIAAITIAIAISLPYIPFSVVISSFIYPYDTTEIVYQTWFSLLRDVLPVVIPLVIFSVIYPLKMSQLEVADWFEFWIGVVLGGVFGELFMPMGPAPSLYFIIGFILGPALLILILSFEEPSSGYAGIFFGFIALPGLTLILQPVGIAYWLALAIVLGMLLNSFHILGTKLTPLILALSIFAIIRFIFSNIFSFIALLLGLAIPLIIKLDLKTSYKIVLTSILIIGFCIVTLYITGNFAQTLMFAIIFTALLTFGLFITFELYVNTVRTSLFRWVIQQFEESKDKKVDILNSEFIIKHNKKDKRITKESTLFAWLSYVILRPLEKQGYSVSIAEEAINDKKYIKSILVSPKVLQTVQ